MKEISFQLILANKLFLIPKCWFQTTGLFLDTRVSTGRNRIESNMQEVLLNKMLPLNYRDVPWYRSVSTGRNKSKATSGKKKSENMSLGIIIFVPLEFRLSQRGANSATPSSFTILAEYDLENQVLIAFLRLFRFRHKTVFSYYISMNIRNKYTYFPYLLLLNYIFTFINEGFSSVCHMQDFLYVSCLKNM